MKNNILLKRKKCLKYLTDLESTNNISVEHGKMGKFPKHFMENEDI